MADELNRAIEAYGLKRRSRSSAQCQQNTSSFPGHEEALACQQAALAASDISAKKLKILARRRENAGKAAHDDGLLIVNTKSPLCQRIRILLAYDGAAFHGWMVQPGFRTVQGVLEDSLRPLLGQRIRLVPAGRTDAGVHALAQVCQTEAVLVEHDLDRVLRQLTLCFNAHLPSDIRILNMNLALPSFNVMVTRWKCYIYRVRLSKCVPPCSDLKLPLDVNRMNDAASVMLGSHDFAGFQTRGGRQSTVRVLYRCEVISRDNMLEIVMEGNGFLYNMCRIIAGTLIEVGCLARDAASIEPIFTAGDRALAGPTLPAEGLRLEHVEHDQEWSVELSRAIEHQRTKWNDNPDMQGIARATERGADLADVIKSCRFCKES